MFPIPLASRESPKGSEIRATPLSENSFAVFGRNPIRSRRLARQLHHLAESIRVQGGLRSPRQDLPAVVVQHRDQVVPDMFSFKEMISIFLDGFFLLVF